MKQTGSSGPGESEYENLHRHFAGCFSKLMSHCYLTHLERKKVSLRQSTNDEYEAEFLWGNMFD